jgi:hypothetical protein
MREPIPEAAFLHRPRKAEQPTDTNKIRRAASNTNQPERQSKPLLEQNKIIKRKNVEKRRVQKRKRGSGRGGGLRTSALFTTIPSFRAFKRDTTKTSNKKFYDSPPKTPVFGGHRLLFLNLYHIRMFLSSGMSIFDVFFRVFMKKSHSVQPFHRKPPRPSPKGSPFRRSSAQTKPCAA